MSDIRVERVASVDRHPTSDNPMDVVIVESGAQNVANRDDSETPRDTVGDTVIVIPEGYLLPEALLRHNDLWREDKSKGILKGSKGNRTCVKGLAGVDSQVMLVRVDEVDDNTVVIRAYNGGDDLVVPRDPEALQEALGITKWVNPN